MTKIEILTRLIISVLIGGIIGFEREYKNRPAGLRTHMLVCVGSCVVSIIQILMIEEATNMITANPALNASIKVDIGRMSAGVISGIGFIGAGTIIHHKGSVSGLTTAATLWIVACIGIAIGMGYYFLCISTTVIIILVVVLIKKFEKKHFLKANNELDYEESE
ncbi:MgtC/SapB family protein [Clostridium sp. DL1XJH146]